MGLYVKGDARVKIVRKPEELEQRPRAVAIGTFDGVHLGHRRVLDDGLLVCRAPQRAQEAERSPAPVTPGTTPLNHSANQQTTTDTDQ
jgi:FAD synthase